LQLGLNPYTNGLGTVSSPYPVPPNDADIQLDCGDVPVSPFDSAIAIKQIKAAYSSMLNHPVANPGKMAELGMAKGLDGEYHPRVIALGGDHTIVRHSLIRIQRS
jgi:agmatinase